MKWKKVGLWTGGALLALIVIGALAPAPDEAEKPGPDSAAVQTQTETAAMSSGDEHAASGPLRLINASRAPGRIDIELTNTGRDSTYVTLNGFRLIDSNETAIEPERELSDFPDFMQVGPGENVRGRLGFVFYDKDAAPFRLRYEYAGLRAEAQLPQG